MKHLFWLWLVGFALTNVARAENGKAYSGVYHCEDPGEVGIARNPRPFFYVGWANVRLDGVTGDISAVMGVRNLDFPPRRVSGRAIIDYGPGTYVISTTYRLADWDTYNPGSALELDVLDFPRLHGANGGACLSVFFRPDENARYVCVPYADWKANGLITPAACH